jgi:small neutral amino acid transporter SnatA (MarC family)
MSRWPEIFATAVTLSLVMDPLGNLPVFLSSPASCSSP